MQQPGTLEMPAFDCALTNEEILAHQDEMGSSSCTPRPTGACTTALDCPRGLGCTRGQCGPCLGLCRNAEGRPFECGGNPSCAEGEVCVERLCIPEANVTCRSFSDCPDGEECLLSGVDWSAGRGNGATRSFCGRTFSF